MPQTTLNFYLTLLEALFLIIRQPAWHKNVTKKMTKSPKIYALDAGMMAFLIGANEKRLSSDSSLLGILVETFVVTEIEKLMSWDAIRLQSYHYRTATGIEVDILLENRAGEIVGIEVKSSAMVHANDFKGLHYLKEEIGSRFIKGIVLYSGEEIIPFGDRLYAVPLSALWT